MSKEQYRYDPETCITAGELRARGWDLGENIPDVASIPRTAVSPAPEAFTVDQDEKDPKLFHFTVGAVITQPFRWIEGTVTFKEENGKEQ